MTADRGAAASASAVGGNAVAGEAIFFGKGACATCHDINGRGGAVGSDLSAAGQLPVATIQAGDPRSERARAAGRRTRRRPRRWARRRGASRHRRRQAPGRPRGARHPPQRGHLLAAARRRDRPFHSIDKMAVAGVRIDPASLMPAYKDKLTEEEVANLVAYLAAQRARDAAKTAGVPMTEKSGGITYERLAASDKEPHNWLMFWGDYRGTHYSALKQIDTTNVGRLQAAWASPMPGDADPRGDAARRRRRDVHDRQRQSAHRGRHSTRAPAADLALHAPAEGHATRTRSTPSTAAWRSSAIGCSSARSTPRSIALDARSGAVLWEVQIADTMLGYELTSPPLVVKDKVIVGMAGGEFGDPRLPRRLRRGERQAAVALVYRARPGRVRQRHVEGRQLEDAAAAPMWLTGSYDPELNTVYWAVGNPAPADRSQRRAATATTCSATRWSPSTRTPVPASGTTSSRPTTATTGIRLQALVLVDRVWHGPAAKLLLHADRNGFFYVLDRTWEVPRRHALRLPELEHRVRRRRAGRESCRGRTPAPRAASRLPDAGRRHQLPGALVQPADGALLPGLCRERAALREPARPLRAGAAIHRPRPGGPAASPARRASRRLVGHQGDRPGDRRDDVGLQDVAGLADRTACSRPPDNVLFALDSRRQPRRARYAHRRALVALPDRSLRRPRP